MECFKIYADETEGRLDPYFYRSEFKELEVRLKNINIISFGEIIERIVNGFDYRDFSDDGLIYLRVSNIKPFRLDLIDVKKINLKYSNIAKNIKLKKGNILLTRKGTFGVALSVKKDSDFVISSEIFRIILKPNISSKYVELILNSNICQKQFDKYKIGAIMGSLSQEAVKKIKIPLPSSKVQNWVVGLINNVYELKEQKETEARQLLDSINDYVLNELDIKLSESKDKMTYVVCADYVRGGRADVYYHQTKFKNIEGEVKRGKYKLLKINDVLEYFKKGIEVGSNAYVPEGIPFVRVADIDDYKINYDKTDKKISLEDYRRLKNNYKPRQGEILYSKDGTIGICVIVEEEKNFIVSGGILRLKVKEGVNKYYIKTILSNCILKILAEHESIGSIIKHLRLEKFLDLKIPLPPSSIQNKIANEVKYRMNKAKQLQKEAKKVLEEAKSKVERIILGAEKI